MKSKALSLVICSLIFNGCPTKGSDTPLSVPADACRVNPTSCGVFVDPRDNQSYYTTQIGSQVWFAQNLNFKTQSSYCYENKEMNCKAYGRLYDFDEAKAVCPTGWHLPSRDEWFVLRRTIGSDLQADNLVSKQDLPRSSDEYRFSALYGGNYNVDLKMFQSEGKNFLFWTSDVSAILKLPIQIYKSEKGITDLSLVGPKSGGSVRCLKD